VTGGTKCNQKGLSSALTSTGGGERTLMPRGEGLMGEKKFSEEDLLSKNFRTKGKSDPCTGGKGMVPTLGISGGSGSIQEKGEQSANHQSHHRSKKESFIQLHEVKKRKKSAHREEEKE